MVRAPLGSGRDRSGLLLLALAMAVVVPAGGASTARAATVTEFSTGITAGGHPFGIAAGPDGNLWFTEPDGGRIGRIAPSGAVTALPAGLAPARS